MFRWAVIIALGVACCNGVSADSQRRPLRVGDLLAVESLPPFVAPESAFSPDGNAVAFSTIRSRGTEPSNWQVQERDVAHSDIWIQSSDLHQPKNITHGESDASGWFDPQWSPDGKHLLMKSTRGGSLRLWVWDSAGGGLRLAGPQVVDATKPLDTTIWVDNSRLLFCALSPGRQPSAFFPRMEREATEAWGRAYGGQESSVSALSTTALDEGRTAAESEDNEGDLVLLDSTTGKSRVLVDGRLDRYSLSPNGRWVAIGRSAGTVRPKSDQTLDFSRKLHWLEIRDLEGNLLHRDSESGEDIDVAGWSPSGNELVLWKSDEAHRHPPALYRLDVALGHLRRVNISGLDVNEGSAPQWTADGNLLVRAAEAVDSEKRAPATSRRDWYLVTGNSRQNLTRSLAVPPMSLRPVAHRRAFVGLTAMKLWRVSVDKKAATSAFEKFDGQIESIASAFAERNSEAANYLLHTRSHSGDSQYYVFDRNTFVFTRLGLSIDAQKLGADVQVASYASRSGDALLYANTRNGSVVLRESRSGDSQVLRSINGWLREIDQGNVTGIQYVSLDGESLNACILLPVGYQAGRRYPLLTWVYPGDIQGSDCETIRNDLLPGVAEPSLNLQMLASRGYAVLIPSMPMNPWGQPDEALLRLSDGVLPAVDKVVEAGIADSSRLFLMGHSFGGFATYGLVTQTQRFKAAIAVSGYTDFMSLYGTADVRRRYEPSLQYATFFNMEEMERFQAGMGNPPWKDLGRYLRNSPITYVERVQTPIMMIHGEMDRIPMTQAEEFFASLYRQGKPAQLVRYWGEGHIFGSPANIKDLWSRIFSWLDEYGDIARNDHGDLEFDGDHVRSRSGAPPLTPADFLRLDAQ
jgi:dipeptidyl aminopeptidase/acylaminoacyl peptidase